MVRLLRIGEVHIAENDFSLELLGIGDRIVRRFILLAIEAIDSAASSRWLQRGRGKLEDSLRCAQRLY